MTTWKPQVFVDGKWSSNGLVFATVDEARDAARDLMGRWTLVRDWRAIESNDPVNYRWEGRAVRIEEPEPTDDEIYNRPGVEGGIAYAMDDAPGSLGENDWRL